MAIAGWYLTQTDGSSASGGVPMGAHGMVTFTAASALTPEGGSNIELLVNTANVLNKVDVIRALERIQFALINDQWPPNGQN